MAIGTINDVVFSRVTWLTSTDTDDIAKVDTFVGQTQYYLQAYLLKSDVDTEDEGTYTSKERLLTGLMTSYTLVTNKIMENTGGVNGSAPTPAKVLKKAKADVTEAEFEVLKAEDGGFLIATATQIQDALKGEICQLAISMNIRLPLCGTPLLTSPNDAGALPFLFTCGNTNCC
jgi:hypothetical protein